MIGSPGYIAPERLSGRPAGPESDLWSLGAVLYFAVEGVPAYQASELPVLIGTVLTKDPEPPARAGEARWRLRSVAESSDPSRPAVGYLPAMGPETWQRAGGSTPPVNSMPPTRPGGPFPGAPRPMGAAPNGAGARAGVGRTLRRVALTAGLVLLLGVGAVVANVVWNPLHLIGEGRFARAPVCGGMTPAVVDATIPKPRHEDQAHCEWFSLDNSNLDLKVLSTTRYTRSGWHSAEERAHAAMNQARAANESVATDVNGSNIGDEPGISVDDGEVDDGSGSNVVWFRVSNVVVKMMVTHPHGSSAAAFDATTAALAMARSLERQG
jgi:serine/threonine protein kinase